METNKMQDQRDGLYRSNLYDRQNPDEFLKEFFKEFPLRDAKLELWKLFKAALTSKQELKKGFQRSNTFYFYEWLDRLVEIVFIIDRRTEDPED